VAFDHDAANALERLQLQGATRDDLQHYAYTLDPADNLTDPDGNRIEDEHHTYQWDPIEEEGGINLYAYVGGNPVSYYDPLGLVTQSEINAALYVLQRYYGSLYPTMPNSVTVGPVDGLGYTTWSNNITLGIKYFGDYSTCLPEENDVIFLHTLAHEMWHINEPFLHRLANSVFRMGNPLGFLHRQVDEITWNMVDREWFIREYREARDADKDCKCKKK
jgi:hypothetical protein